MIMIASDIRINRFLLIFFLSLIDDYSSEKKCIVWQFFQKKNNLFWYFIFTTNRTWNTVTKLYKKCSQINFWQLFLQENSATVQQCSSSMTQNYDSTLFSGWIQILDSCQKRIKFAHHNSICIFHPYFFKSLQKIK